MNRLQRIASALLVEEHEWPLVRHFLLLSALIGAGLALGRASADTLFLKRLGIEHLPTIYALTGVALAITSLTYAAFADRLAAERLFGRMFVVLAALVAACWLLMAVSESRIAYPIYYLVYEVASELLATHAALYFSQNFDQQQVKRLYGLAFAGLQIGKLAGGGTLLLLAPALGVANLLLVWTAGAAAAAVLLRRHHRRHGVSPYFSPAARRHGSLARTVEQIAQGWRFASESPLARAAAGSMFCLVIAYYLLSYAVSRLYTAIFPTEAQLGAFLGALSAVTALLALAVQVLATPRLLERLGARKTNLIFPLTTLASFAALLASFGLPAALIASLNKDALMPAIRNPTRQLLLNALPGYMQGRVRALTTGLVLPAALVLCGSGLLWMQARVQPVYFLVAGIVATLFYLRFNRRMNRAYSRSLLTSLREKLFLPRTAGADAGHELFDELARGLRADDDETAIVHARELARRFPASAAPVLLAAAEAAPSDRRETLVEIALALDAKATAQALCDWPVPEETGARARRLMQRFRVDADAARREAAALLDAGDPRLAAAGIFGVLHHGLPGSERAQGRWRELFGSGEETARLAAIRLFTHRPQSDLRDELAAQWRHPSGRVRRETLGALADTATPDWSAGIEDVLREAIGSGDPVERRLALLAARALPVPSRRVLAERLLADPHPQVREQALAALGAMSAEPVAELVRLACDRTLPPRTRDQALQALLAQRAARVDFQVVADHGLQEAESLRAALEQVEKQRPAQGALALLAIVLRERVRAGVELALAALEGIENRETIRVIRAGLASGERRHVAAALEALTHSVHRDLAERLARLLRNEAPAGGVAPAADLGAALHGLAQHDEWLRTCAEWARRSMATEAAVHA